MTLEDLIETVLGTEIVDENDSVVDLQKMARRRMQKRFYLEKEMENIEKRPEPEPFMETDEDDEGGTDWIADLERSDEMENGGYSEFDEFAEARQRKRRRRRMAGKTGRGKPDGRPLVKRFRQRGQ